MADLVENYILIIYTVLASDPKNSKTFQTRRLIIIKQ